MQKIIVIAGPTAVGKSAVAITVAQQHNAEIINADSVSVYRGLRIGAAKPSEAERQAVVHHLLDIADPNDNYTVADFQQDAQKAVHDIISRGKLPLVVGGTGLYIRALVWGFAFTHSGMDDHLRQKYYELANTAGNEAVYAKLQEVDPQTAQKLHPNDLRRVVRALEVYEKENRPISEQLQQTPQLPVYDALQFCLTMPRDILYQRIERRVDQMLEQGFLAEVENLLQSGVSAHSKAMQSLGYKQLVAYLQGDMTLSEAILQIKRDTRRFAKRQLTWFRREKDINWLNLQNDGKIIDAAGKISFYLAGYYQDKENTL